MRAHDVSIEEEVAYFHQQFERLAVNVDVFVRGKAKAVREALICLFAQGHLLIEDVPGVAKTSLAKAISRSLTGCTVRRIQFTPDLLPTDVTGVQIYDPKENEFTFRPGPVFTNILLGDEINRASPKTQSALLEVMAERQVTIDGLTHEVPDPFLCIATQNPVEHQGTFALPEAQLDRFMMRISIGYPSHLDEISVLANGIARRVPEQLAQVMELDHLRAMTAIVTRIHVAPQLQSYIVQIVSATRNLPDVRLGVSPRGTVALAVASQARAAANGRSFVQPDDVKALALPVLGHRMIITSEARAQGRTAEDVLREVLASVEVPVSGQRWS